MSQEGQPLEGAENRHLTATRAPATTLPAMREPVSSINHQRSTINRPQLSSAASKNWRGGTSGFLSVSVKTMKTIRNILVLGTAAVALAAAWAEENEAVKKDLAQLQGEWVMVSGSADGQPMPEDMLKQMK